jgi:hypothetical protein
VWISCNDLFDDVGKILHENIWHIIGRASSMHERFFFLIKSKGNQGEIVGTFRYTLAVDML